MKQEVSEQQLSGSGLGRFPAPARLSGTLLTITIGAILAAACGSSDPTLPSQVELTGAITIDGSSTVFPVTEAVAEEFRGVAPRVRTTVGISGTGGGFKRFCTGETDISNASRPMKATEQVLCADNNVNSIQLVVGIDGLAVLVNPTNNWVTDMRVDELKRIWEPGSQINTWSQIRPEWPNEKIKLFGPGTDSGTFDYFTEAIVGKEDASRSDFTASEDDNVLVQGIAGEKGSLGYFGFAYYAENKAKLKAVAINNGTRPVEPTSASINSGEYTPLSRPLFIYVNAKSILDKSQVREFVLYYLRNAPILVPDVGYVPLPQADYDHGVTTVLRNAA